MARFYLSFYAPTGLLGELRPLGRRLLQAADILSAIREAAGDAGAPPVEARLTLLMDGRGVVRWAREGAVLAPDAIMSSAPG
jgi:hypothetical protein